MYPHHNPSGAGPFIGSGAYGCGASLPLAQQAGKGFDTDDEQDEQFRRTQ
ncbi:hypothetical protein SAMN05421770_11091 [Granulicella rosea]|uniref:Uncharacterized protein n=1 Tax=Granulicella rosea TaxID=474952 RepID=A0A239M7P3_9BACT|nr:hypothetical protein SAMN05421770_11091 [Granulicella rosea]